VTLGQSTLHSESHTCLAMTPIYGRLGDAPKVQPHSAYFCFRDPAGNLPSAKMSLREGQLYTRFWTRGLPHQRRSRPLSGLQRPVVSTFLTVPALFEDLALYKAVHSYSTSSGDLCWPSFRQQTPNKPCAATFFVFLPSPTNGGDAQ
jgi:hypothetical protein